MKKYHTIKQKDAESRINLYEGIITLVDKLNELGYDKKVYRYLCDFYHYFRNVNKHEVNFEHFFRRLREMYVDFRYQKLFIWFFNSYFKWETYNPEFFFLVFAPKYKLLP